MLEMMETIMPCLFFEIVDMYRVHLLIFLIFFFFFVWALDEMVHWKINILQLTQLIKTWGKKKPKSFNLLQTLN